jgi:hypothetical protein
MFYLTYLRRELGRRMWQAVVTSAWLGYPLRSGSGSAR